METEFSSLSKRLVAAIDPAYNWLLIGMSVLMFSQILWKSKDLAAILAWKCLFLAMNVVVSL